MSVFTSRRLSHKLDRRDAVQRDLPEHEDAREIEFRQFHPEPSSHFTEEAEERCCTWCGTPLPLDCKSNYCPDDTCAVEAEGDDDADAF